MLEALAAMRAELADASRRGPRPIGPLSAAIGYDMPEGTQGSVSFELDGSFWLDPRGRFENRRYAS